MASTVPGGWRPHMVSTGKKKLWICSGPVSQDEHPSQLLRGRVAALGRDASTQCLRVTFQFRPGPDSSAMPARSSIVVTATQPRSPSSLMWRSNTWGMTPRRFHLPSSTHISAGCAAVISTRLVEYAKLELRPFSPDQHNRAVPPYVMGSPQEAAQPRLRP